MKNPTKLPGLLKKVQIFAKSFGYILLVVSSFLIFAQSKTIAQAKPTVTISPFLQEVKVSTEDQTKDFLVTITNNSAKPLGLNLSVLDFGSLNDSGGIVFSGSQSSSLLKKYGLSTWLQLSNKTISIDAGKKATLTATIINDTSLQPGGHYAAIIASVIDPAPIGGEDIEINQKLSSLVLATKVGGEKYDLKLQTIETRGSKFSLPKTVNLNFKNPGNVHVVPRGVVKIVAPTGKVVSQGIINEDSSFVLPETSRQLQVQMRPIGSAGLWPALYRVEVDYRYDGIEQSAHKSQTVYFLNLRALTIICIIFAGMGWLLLKKRHLFKRVKKNQKIKKVEVHEEHKPAAKKIVKIPVK